MYSQIIDAEISYSRLFCQSSEERNLIRFWDDEIQDMYTHNFILIKNHCENVVEIISNEIARSIEQNRSFLRIELNHEIENIDEVSPTEWEGPDHGWDSFIHISWEELDQYVEEVRSKGGIIAIEPFTGAHGKWEFKNAHIQDIDGYNLVLGAMRLKNEEDI